MRLEGPCRIRAELALHPQGAEHSLRFRISRDHHGVMAIARAKPREGRVHVTSFSPIPDRKLILAGSHAQRTNEKRGERVRKLALEHRPFARDHAMMLPHFLVKKRRE